MTLKSIVHYPTIIENLRECLKSFLSTEKLSLVKLDMFIPADEQKNYVNTVRYFIALGITNEAPSFMNKTIDDIIRPYVE